MLIIAEFYVCSSTIAPDVVLTRERGKNDEVKRLLEDKGVHCLEIPMVETEQGPDFDQLPHLLRSELFDWVCITSPEAASVFVQGWKDAGKPHVNVAVVGKGTGKILKATNEPMIQPKFTPSVANAEHFGPELPKIPGGNNRVLYPSSAKASTLLQEGLEQRDFRVLRLNTYNTVTVKHVKAETLDQARRAKVVAIASPSALKAWVQHIGQPVTSQMTIAAIGSTSARAAENLGLDRILYPGKPGIDTFVETIIDALQYDTA